MSGGVDVSPELGLFTDFQGRLVVGDDLEITSQQSAVHTAQTLTVGAAATPAGPSLKRRLLQVTVTYSANVTANVTITLVSALGAAWNTLLDTIALAAASSGVSTKVIGMELAPGDSLQVVAPDGGVGVTSNIAVYDQILGATARAVDATS